MLDAEARALLDLIDKATQEGRPKLHTLPYAAGRAAADKLLEDSEADPPEVAAVEDGSFAGPAGEIGYRRYQPLGLPSGPLPTLIYYHGGGFVFGTLETHDSSCRRLANKSRCQLIAIDSGWRRSIRSPRRPTTASRPSAISATTPPPLTPTGDGLRSEATRPAAPSLPSYARHCATPARGDRRSRC